MTEEQLILTFFCVTTLLVMVGVAFGVGRYNRSRKVDEKLSKRGLDEVWGAPRLSGLDRTTCNTVMIMPSGGLSNILNLTEDGDPIGTIDTGTGMQATFNCKFMKRKAFPERKIETSITGARREVWHLKSDEQVITTLWRDGVDINFELPAEGRFVYSTLSGDLKRNNEIASIQIHPKGASFLFYVVLHKSLSPEAKALICYLPFFARKISD